MSGVVDVGDALELTFITNPGATVTVSWYDPDTVTVTEDAAVTESPASSGRFPHTFLPTRAGMWKAEFHASGTATANDQYWVRARSLTGPAPLAAVGDVAEQQSLTTAQESLAAVLLRAASQMIRARRPGIDTQILTGDVPGDLVALAATNMVLRVLRNPGGIRSETVGPFSVTYDTTYAAGLLILTADDEVLLNPIADPAVKPTPVRTIQARPTLGIAAVRPYSGRRPDGWW